MLKNVLCYGLLSGGLMSAFMVYMAMNLANDPNFEASEIVGYASMIIVFSLIFVAIRNFRNQQANGSISFWKAFQIGALIALIGSTMYVVAWLIYYHNFVPDFIDKFSAHVLKAAAEKGASAEELATKTKEMADFKEMYKSPFWQIVFTYMEILPVGLAVTLISSFILKRQPATA